MIASPGLRPPSAPSILPAPPAAARTLSFSLSRRLSNLRNCVFEVADSMDQVLEAWHVLYQSYIRAGFIRARDVQLHTVPQAIGEHALIVLARSHGVPVSTITAIGDGPLGLPLDAVYEAELGGLRRRGRKVMEIGLFGDRRDADGGADRSFTSVFELMRYTFFFGVHTGVTDFVCGIPPRRAALYQRCFGFRPVGQVKSYSTVEDNPVILLHARTEHLFANPTKYRAVDYFFNHPLTAEAFESRFRFDDEEVRASPLMTFFDKADLPARSIAAA